MQTLSLYGFNYEEKIRSSELYQTFLNEIPIVLETKIEHFPNHQLKKRYTCVLQGDQLVRHGIYKEYDIQGDLIEEGCYLNGMRFGEWLLNEENTRLYGSYCQDKKCGKFYRFSKKNNLLSEEEYYNDIEHGSWVYYSPTGGVARKVSFLFGKKQFKEEIFYRNGKLSLTQNWNGGILDGSIDSFDDEGNQIYHGYYSLGTPDGEWIWYSKNGTFLEKTLFFRGSGVFCEVCLEKNNWYLSKRTFLRSGVLQGNTYYYNSFGSVTRKEIFDQGILIQSFDYNAEGKCIRASEFDSQGNCTLSTEYAYPVSGSKYVCKKVSLDNLGRLYVEEINSYGVVLCTYFLLNNLKEGECCHYTEEGKLISRLHYCLGNLHGGCSFFTKEGKLSRFIEYSCGVKHGIYEEWYVNKDRTYLKWKTSYYQGILHGVSLKFSENGKLLEKVSYVNGKEEGLYTRYYENSHQKQFEGFFKQGKKDGIWTSWFENQLKESCVEFSLGLQNGKVLVWYDYLCENNPVLKYEGNYLLGKKEGQWVYYHKNGMPHLIQNYHNDLLNGETLSFYEIGKLKEKLKFFQGKQQGVQQSFFANGKLEKEISFISGLQIGEEVSFYLNGKKHYQGTWCCGLREGTWTWWDPQSKKILKTSSFSKGSGIFYSFYDSGCLEKEIVYERGLKTKSYSYYPSGVLRKREIFSFGVLDGLQEEFSSSSQIIERVNWNLGDPLRYSSYFGNGHLKEKGYFYFSYRNGDYIKKLSSGEIKIQGNWFCGLKHNSWIENYGVSNQKGNEHYFFSIPFPKKSD